MFKKVLPKTKKVLIDAELEKCFWLCDGQILKNLKELALALKKMKKEVFNYHVTKEKNDFVNWIKDVFGEEKLAFELKKTKTAKAAAKKIEAIFK